MRRSAPTPPPACALPAFLILHRRAAFADAFVWPDDLQKMVYAYVIRAELIEHRQRAAATLTRHVLARLTRTWFVCRDMPALASHAGLAWADLLWPHAGHVGIVASIVRRSARFSRVWASCVAS